jgi:hypothetical protein
MPVVQYMLGTIPGARVKCAAANTVGGSRCREGQRTGADGGRA